jgi:hypothetical protein
MERGGGCLVISHKARSAYTFSRKLKTVKGVSLACWLTLESSKMCLTYYSIIFPQSPILTLLLNTVSSSNHFHFFQQKQYYNNTDFHNFTIPASLLTQYGWRWFLATLSCTKLTISGLIGALKTAGNAMVEPDASFLSLYTVIRGRAADSACNQNNNSEIATASFLLF